MIKKIITAFAISCCFESCYIFFNQAILPKPVDIIEKKLRLDGYYYTVEKNESEDSKSIFSALIIPYSNSIFYGDMNSGKGHDFNDNINEILNGNDKYIIEISQYERSFDPQKNYMINKWNWGSFKYEGETILMQKRGGRMGDCIVTYVGKILNDTTFNIIFRSSTRCAGDSYEERLPDSLDLLFHFRKFSTKPDSSNYMNYLKKLDQ